MNASKHPKAILSDVKGRGGKATGSLEVNGIKNAEKSDGDNYPDGMKVLYWNLMNDYGKIIEGHRSD